MSVARTRGRWALLAAAAAALPAAWLARATLFDPEIAFLASRNGARWIVYPSPANPRIRPEVELDTTFRRVFSLESVPPEAVIRIRAFGRYEVQINDRVVDLPVDRRNWKQLRERPVADHLHAGENEISITVFNDRGPPALWMSLAAEPVLLVTDASWEASLAGATWLQARLAARPPTAARLGIQSATPLPLAAFATRWRDLLAFASIAAVALLGIALACRRLQARVLVAGACLLAGLVWSALIWNNVPSLTRTDGFDAAGHLDYVQYILDHRKVPWPDEGWTMYHPPLYYAISAALLAAADLPTRSDTALSLLRVQSLAFGVLQLALVFGSLRLLFPRQPREQLLGFVLATFMPVQLYAFQLITNETLGATLAAASVYVGLRVLEAERVSARASAILGLCLGMAMLAKFSALVVVAAVLLALGWKLARERVGPAAWVRGPGVCAVVCLGVSAWRFVAVWWRFGEPFVSNWAPEISVDWWQDPGYHTWGYYLRFGRSLIAPYFSGVYSFADGFYSTCWGDGLATGRTHAWNGPPWNQEAMAAGYVLALLPSVAILLGAILSFAQSSRSLTPSWLLVNALAAAVAALLFYLSLKVPFYSSAKALYALPALVPLCAWGARGMEAIGRRLAPVRWISFVLLGVWAINAYATFWIPRGGARAHARLGRLSAPAREREELALHHLDTALVLDPDNRDARLGLAQVLARRGQAAEALFQLQALLGKQEDDIDALLLMAPIVAAQGALEQAVELARRAARLAPDDERVWPALAHIESQRGRNELAIAAWQEAVRVRPADAGVHQSLGAALEALGELDAAREHYRRASLLSPHPQEVETPPAAPRKTTGLTPRCISKSGLA